MHPGFRRRHHEHHGRLLKTVGFCRRLLTIITNQETIMSDFSKLNADIAALSAKVDELLAKQVPPVDDQPAVDAVDAQVTAILAKIP